MSNDDVQSLDDVALDERPDASRAQASEFVPSKRAVDELLADEVQVERKLPDRSEEDVLAIDEVAEHALVGASGVVNRVCSRRGDEKVDNERLPIRAARTRSHRSRVQELHRGPFRRPPAEP